MEKSYNNIYETILDEGEDMKNRRRRKARRFDAGGASVIIVVVAFILVIAFQICQLKQKEEAYAAQESDLKAQYEQETERTQEIADLEAYMKTTQYIEDVAKTKLGLVHDNEIIFKESEE